MVDIWIVALDFDRFFFPDFRRIINLNPKVDTHQDEEQRQDKNEIKSGFNNSEHFSECHGHFFETRHFLRNRD